jgi:hypothetical protein
MNCTRTYTCPTCYQNHENDSPKENTFNKGGKKYYYVLGQAKIFTKTSELWTVVFGLSSCRTTWCHYSEDQTPYLHCSKNLKSHTGENPIHWYICTSGQIGYRCFILMYSKLPIIHVWTICAQLCARFSFKQTQTRVNQVFNHLLCSTFHFQSGVCVCVCVCFW